MELHISIDKKYYKSDSIENGRIIGKFFVEMVKNVFNQSYRYWEKHCQMTKSGEMPLLYSERNLYSTFAVAIDKITPIHLSEWSLNPSDYNKLDIGRRVDLWCLTQNGESGKRLNYFIEIKKGHYNLNKNSKKEFQKSVEEDINSLAKQITSIKKLSLEWAGDDNVFLGVPVIHGFYLDGKKFFDANNVRENIYEQIDKRSNAQLLVATWILPDDMNIQWEEKKCSFISIAGIVISKKPSA